VTTDYDKYEYNCKTWINRIAIGLSGVVDEASYLFSTDTFRRSSLLNAKEKEFLILVNDIFRLGNRMSACLLLTSGIRKDISYKKVERLYSDHIVIMILNNLKQQVLVNVTP